MFACTGSLSLRGGHAATQPWDIVLHISKNKLHYSTRSLPKSPAYGAIHTIRIHALCDGFNLPTAIALDPVAFGRIHAVDNFYGSSFECLHAS